MKPQTKLDARARKAQILSEALKLAATRGYACLTRDEVAAAAGIASSLVAHHMGTMQAFKRDLMREAVRVECLPVVAQGLACRDPHALKASDELRARAAASLT